MPPPQRNPTIELSIDMESLNKVLDILGDKPFKQVADLIVDLKNQAQTQLQQMYGQMRPNGGDVLPPAPPPH